MIMFLFGFYIDNYIWSFKQWLLCIFCCRCTNSGLIFCRLTVKLLAFISLIWNLSILGSCNTSRFWPIHNHSNLHGSEIMFHFFGHPKCGYLMSNLFCNIEIIPLSLNTISNIIHIYCAILLSSCKILQTEESCTNFVVTSWLNIYSCCTSIPFSLSFHVPKG